MAGAGLLWCRSESSVNRRNVVSCNQGAPKKKKTDTPPLQPPGGSKKTKTYRHTKASTDTNVVHCPFRDAQQSLSARFQASISSEVRYSALQRFVEGEYSRSCSGREVSYVYRTRGYHIPGIKLYTRYLVCSYATGKMGMLAPLGMRQVPSRRRFGNIYRRLGTRGKEFATKIRTS